MRKLFDVLLVALAALAILTLGACGPLNTDPEIRTATETVLDGILSGDVDTVLGVTSGISRSDLASTLPQMREILLGSASGSYTTADCEITQTGVSVKLQDGQTYRIVTYSVTVSWRPETYTLTSTAAEPDTGKLVGFNLVQRATCTGTLKTMKDADVSQWLFVILWAATLAFMCWMFVDCLCHKIKKKAVWALVIVLASVGLTFVLAEAGFKFNFNLFNVLDPGRLEKWSNGDRLLKFYVPVGAILYLIKRKSLIADGAKTPTEAAPAEVPAAQTAPDAPDSPEAKDADVYFTQPQDEEK